MTEVVGVGAHVGEGGPPWRQQGPWRRASALRGSAGMSLGWVGRAGGRVQSHWHGAVQDSVEQWHTQCKGGGGGRESANYSAPQKIRGILCGPPGAPLAPWGSKKCRPALQSYHVRQPPSDIGIPYNVSMQVDASVPFNGTMQLGLNCKQ